MPPSLIQHGEALAKQSRISFGELVRRALRAYDPTRDEEEMLSAMAEAMQSSVKEARAAVRVARKEVKKTRQALRKEKNNGRNR